MAVFARYGDVEAVVQQQLVGLAQAQPHPQGDARFPGLAGVHFFQGDDSPAQGGVGIRAFTPHADEGEAARGAQVVGQYLPHYHRWICGPLVVGVKTQLIGCHPVRKPGRIVAAGRAEGEQLDGRPGPPLKRNRGAGEVVEVLLLGG